MSKEKLIVFVFLSLLLIPTFVFSDTVMVNSKDWRELYLSAIYADKIGYDFNYFDSLLDSKVQTDTLKRNERLIIIESDSQPVVKNYASVLKNNGFNFVKSIISDDYSDLQLKLWADENPKGYVILDPTYGAEAMTAAPYLLLKDYLPIFLEFNNKNEMREFIESGRKMLFLGHFPLRLIHEYPGERITGWSPDNTVEMTKKVLEIKNFEWGSMVADNKMDLFTLSSKRPFFVFHESVDDFSNSVGDSGLSKFEVIGGELADVSKQAEITAGRNIDLLLKFAQTITNLESFEGRLLSLKRIDIPAVRTGLQIERSDYYSEMGIFTVTFVNTGNVPVNFFSNIEFGDSVFADEEMHYIWPGELITIPYKINGTGDINTAFISTRYGYEKPLASNIIGAGGLPIVNQNVTVDSYKEISSVEISKIKFNEEKGEFYVEVTNLNNFPTWALVEIKIDEDTVISTKRSALPANSKVVLRINAPFTEVGIIPDKFYNVLVLHGGEDLLNSNYFENIFIEKDNNLLWIYQTLIIIVIVLVLLGFVLFLFKRRKKKDDEEFEDL